MNSTIDHTQVPAEEWPPPEFINRVPSYPRKAVSQAELYSWLNLPEKPTKPCQQCGGVRFWVRMPVTEEQYEHMRLTHIIDGEGPGIIPALDDSEWRCQSCFDWESGNSYKTPPHKAIQRLRKIKEKRLPRMVYICIVKKRGGYVAAREEQALMEEKE
jgi:hypothetical protein